MFKINQTILVNQIRFVVTKIADVGTAYEMLQGTLETDPSFLAGKRSIAVFGLTHVGGNAYTYNWDEK